MNVSKSLIGALALGFAATSFAGPSAKFAATYTESPALSSVAVITDSDVDKVVNMTSTGHILATIKVPQQKELLVGLSAEIGLVTDTSLRGKDGGSAKSIAGAEAYVTIFAVPTGQYDPSVMPSIKAKPGTVILSKRVQELSATLAGVIQTCNVAADLTLDVATDCTVTDEEIGLMQDTTAAQHFNFVLPNMESGEYDIVAVFTTGANAEIDVCTSAQECALYDPDGTISGSSYAKAIVNKTMLTLQEVRAAKGGVNGVIINVDDQTCSIDGQLVACE